MTVRVAFLTPSLHVGGAERWILSLCRHLRRVRPECIFLTDDFWHQDILAEARRLCDVVFPEQWNETAVRRAIAEHADRFDVLVMWGDPRLSRLRRGLVKPVVCVSHAAGDWEEHRRLLHRYCMAADYHAAVSQAAARAYPPETVSPVVIYNGVELDRTAPRRGRQMQREEWGIGPDDRVALYLFRFAPEKGIDRLLEAIPALAELRKNWKIVFVGHGPKLADVLQAEREYPETVVYRPPVAEPGDCLAGADILLLPSRTEGMPLLLLESLAAGLPVAAALRIPAIEEVRRLLPEAPIVGLDENDFRRLARRIDYCANDPRLSRRPDPDVFRLFSATAMAARWEGFLESVVRHYERHRS